MQIIVHPFYYCSDQINILRWGQIVFHSILALLIVCQFKSILNLQQIATSHKTYSSAMHVWLFILKQIGYEIMDDKLINICCP